VNKLRVYIPELAMIKESNLATDPAPSSPATLGANLPGKVATAVEGQAGLEGIKWAAGKVKSVATAPLKVLTHNEDNTNKPKTQGDVVTGGVSTVNRG
jgi:hypothetical protein